METFTSTILPISLFIIMMTMFAGAIYNSWNKGTVFMIRKEGNRWEGYGRHYTIFIPYWVHYSVSDSYHEVPTGDSFDNKEELIAFIKQARGANVKIIEK
jgi:hypothetical protein